MHPTAPVDALGKAKLDGDTISYSFTARLQVLWTRQVYCRFTLRAEWPRGRPPSTPCLPCPHLTRDQRLPPYSVECAKTQEPVFGHGVVALKI